MKYYTSDRRRKPQTRLSLQHLSDTDVRTSHERNLSDEPRTLKNSGADKL